MTKDTTEHLTPCDMQSPAASDDSGYGMRRDVPQDDNSRAAGGPAHNIALSRVDELEAEIAGLRLAIARLADQDATLSVQGGNVIVKMDATLTDAEREAIEGVIAAEHRRGAWQWAATLRGLLERLG